MARGDINIELDGYYYWRGLSAWDLRDIADKLDKINEKWHEEVHRVLSDAAKANAITDTRSAVHLAKIPGSN